jgi:hypothetical protein
MERTNDFMHPAYNQSFQHEADLLKKNAKYNKTRGIIKAGLKPTQVQICIQIPPMQELSTASPMLRKRYVVKVKGKVVPGLN